MMLCLVPARGGSKGILRKNLRTVQGHTLTQLAVQACRPYGRVAVSTDDQDIAAVARMCGAEVWERPAELATDDATVDGLVQWIRREHHGELLVYQPTVPQAQPHLKAFLDHARSLGRGCAMASEHRHILWDRWGLLHGRGNRQQLDGVFDEVGVRWYPPGGTVIESVWPCPQPLVDVDTPDDLARVRVEPKRILLRAVANRKVGSGHVRRCVQIADELQHHRIALAPAPGSDMGMFSELAGGYPLVVDGWPRDLCVNDVLDTSEEDMFELRFGGPVVALEDMGPGAGHASLLVNELYAAGVPGELVGPDWAVLRPVFTAAPWPHRFDHSRPRLLVTFGGTDPSGLTDRLRRLVPLGWDSVIVDPPAQGGRADLASLLVWADLVVCSGGRTVWEAMACGTPALVLCQNPRELSHTHLRPEYGVLNLGLGRLVDDETIMRHLTVMLGDRELLGDMSDRMAGVVDGRGALRIAHRIEGILGGL